MTKPAAAVRSMTGYARGTRQVQHGLNATLTFRSVNHRFLDIQMRLPGGLEWLERPLREVIKQHVVRGHVDVYLQLERETNGGLEFNAKAIQSYVAAFRLAAEQASLPGEPDLNAILRIPAVISAENANAVAQDSALEREFVAHATDLLQALNGMRSAEGAALAGDLQQTMHALDAAVEEAAGLRADSRQARYERMQTRLSELTGGAVDADRLLQEAALIVERADIEEEIVRLRTHAQHFRGIIERGGESGKRLDFLLQEMNREANTLLSKTIGTAGDALRITEIGLAVKGAIEKAREQIQNLE